MAVGKPRISPPPPVFDIKVTGIELDMLLEAVDSHVYWQLADERYRSNGAVEEPGSDDEGMAEDIDRFEQLRTKLQAIR